ALLHRFIESRDIGGFLRWAVGRAARLAFQSKMAFDMVVMVVRGENMGELEARALKRFAHGRLFWRVNRCGDAGLPVVNDDSVIVLPAGELNDLESGHGFRSCCLVATVLLENAPPLNTDRENVMVCPCLRTQPV